SVIDGDSEAVYSWRTKNILDISLSGSATTVRIAYTYYANERTVRTMHINRWRAFIMPVNCMMYVDGRIHENHHVYLHHSDATDWKTVSTPLSPVLSPQDMTVVGALNYDILADSPIEIGNHQTMTFESNGAKHEVALVAPYPLDIHWLTEQFTTIVETEAKLFGGLPYDRYVCMVQVGFNVYGGLEHSRSSVNLVDIATMTNPAKSGNLLALLCHEFFHTWNIKRIRPIEYGPFDYINECYSPMLWLAEGFTSYYDDLLSYRCGFMSRNEYIANIGNEHFGKLDRVPGRRAMNVRDASYLAWVKLYAQSPDGNNRHPSYYLKGGIITFLLELHIIATTNGTKRMDDVMRELWAMYLANPSVGLTEDDVFDAVERSTGCNVKAMMTGLLNGTDDIDYAPFLEPFGLVWNTDTMPDAPFTGITPKEDGGKLIISSLEDGMPGQLAGFGIDDEILAVNGIRCTTINGFAELISQSGIGNEAEILASCDGRIFTTQLSPVAKPNPSLSIASVLTESQRTLLDFWLNR
ncbi:MAG: hypothetical protein JNL32_14720, partial [Candidatus Kapabacteria bacterium]|nr:hypothetical protein [Candidatus Kapabacteria bacterium]